MTNLPRNGTNSVFLLTLSVCFLLRIIIKHYIMEVLSTINSFASRFTLLWDERPRETGSYGFSCIKFHWVIGRNPRQHTTKYDLRGFLPLALWNLISENLF